ncbi:MAG: MFS transporter [Spirochaetes bacterium]|nr:MFS transporter [Spirochaetota bacterium]
MSVNISKLRKLTYCSGSTGFSILDNIIGFYLIYLMLPPAESGLPELLNSKPVFLAVNILGIITIFGRIIDSISDPLIAYWTDNAKFRIGRRKFFLLTGAFPFAFCTFLIFTPPFQYISAINAVYVAVTLGLYFFFYTYYMVPYLALIPEFSRDHNDRIFITSFQAVFLLIGAGIAMIGGDLFWKIFQNITPDKMTSFKYSILTLSLFAFISLFIGGIVVKESKKDITEPASAGVLKSVKSTVTNKSFLIYMIAVISFWSTFHIVRSILKYYPIVLLNKEESFSAILMVLLFAGAACFFPLIAFLSAKTSNKTVMLSGLLSFAVISCFTFFIDRFGSFTTAAALIQMALYGYPIGILLVIPNAMVADIAEVDSHEKGVNREAMFFGTQGFFMKVVYGVAVAMVASILGIFGKDAANPLGVKMTGFLGAGFSLAGFVFLLKYPQTKINETLEKIRNT